MFSKNNIFLFLRKENRVIFFYCQTCFPVFYFEEQKTVLKNNCQIEPKS